MCVFFAKSFFYIVTFALLLRPNTRMRRKYILTILLFFGLICLGQEVDHARMQQIYQAVRTPYKYGMVIAPETNNEKIDCPSVFREDGFWYMIYVRYNGSDGNNGRGYETWMAKSEDLLHWTTLGRVLAYGDSGWDMNQRGGFPALVDDEWGGSYRMQKYKGRHWMTYIGGKGVGYEAVNEPLSIGLASTKNKISIAHPWKTYDKPILSYRDADAQWWEQLTQYKSTVYRDKDKTLGAPFIMFYNAGGKDVTHPKGERIGIALSEDLFHWKRYQGNPVFAHDSDGTITGDAQIVKMGDVYVMFYFSAFNPTRKYCAFNTFAASYDLVHWTDWDGTDLIIPSKPYDEMFAHKSCVIKYNGTVYHFYCAVNNAGQRGIALATSKMLGKSEVMFPEPNPTGRRYMSSLNKDWTITYNGKSFTADVPYNLDDYYGCLQQEHGNLHGNATFTKRFTIPELNDKEIFIRFEGVGTYADITLNGEGLGRYDIGRTTQTIDITRCVHPDTDNILTVSVSHPTGITDMPWVCGGCSSEWGFSEGSQPFGIFRPVTLEATDKVRIEPYGVHIWNNPTADSILIDTEIHNYNSSSAVVSLVNKLCAADGKEVVRLTDSVSLRGNETKIVRQVSAMTKPHLWSITDAYLYSLNTIIKRNGKAADDITTPFGIRSISWPLTRKDGDGRFFLNGKPTFINGICEYEHEFGASHAFSNAQIDARVKEVLGAGFNAFRDAHQPHNLRYNSWWDKDGILWWPQFSAHIWFDTPQFRESFMRHLKQWVKERRNSPSIILWGLQNESTLPADFAKACADTIRKMDPTCGSMRLITTCNGGEGTDWNVIQNWGGTYGGTADNYNSELKQPDQLLNGEYGAWRTIGNHTGKDYTEDKFCDLLETKVRKAEEVKDSVCGHFLWLLNSHDNPGRRQPDEALRRIDKVGPYNYKGLFTPWEQPTDAYYMYKAHYVSADKAPFVYIVPSSGKIYSNCDSVKIKHDKTTTVEGYHHGNVVASDIIVDTNYKDADEGIIKPSKNYRYIYRLNCGGDDYTDSYGHLWMQDNTRWSHSWGERFKMVSPYQTSQTSKFSLPVSPLFQTSRFGRHNLYFTFPAKKGDYRVEMYFIEPWYGEGGSETTDCEGMRLFDVAINDSTYINDLDVWAQAGYGHPYKRTLDVHNEYDTINISFPHVNAGQAIISAIAVSTKHDMEIPDISKSPDMWKELDKDVLTKTPDSMLPPRTNNNILEVEGKMVKKDIVWDFNVGIAKVYTIRWRFANMEKPRKLHVRMTDANNRVIKDDDITFVQTPDIIKKRRTTSVTTGTQINAGRYHLILSGDEIDKMIFDKITIE